MPFEGESRGSLMRADLKFLDQSSAAPSKCPHPSNN